MLEVGFRPSRAQVLKSAEAFSVAFWAIAVAVGTYVQFSLPYWRGGSPRPTGCYFTDALLVFVQCRETGADAFLATALTYSWWWSWGAMWMIGFFPLSLGMPLNWLALIALYFVLRLAIRRAPRFSE